MGSALCIKHAAVLWSVESSGFCPNSTVLFSRRKETKQLAAEVDEVSDDGLDFTVTVNGGYR